MYFRGRPSFELYDQIESLLSKAMYLIVARCDADTGGCNSGAEKYVDVDA